MPTFNVNKRKSHYKLNVDKASTNVCVLNNNLIKKTIINVSSVNDLARLFVFRFTSQKCRVTVRETIWRSAFIVPQLAPGGRATCSG